MKLVNRYVREEKPFTKKSLFNELGLEGARGEKVLSLLLSCGALSAAPLRDEFKFNFVGVLVAGNLVIRCFPKYITKKKPVIEFEQALSVIRHYEKESKTDIRLTGEQKRTAFDLLAECLSLLENYAEHGIYSNITHEVENNGSGDILWDRTINMSEPFFCDGSPVYIDLHTRRVVDDDQNYITRLHKHIITECSDILKKADILLLFGMVPLYLSDEPRDHFGPDDYIMERLRAELDVQFDSYKQSLLRDMIRFIEQRNTLLQDMPLMLYGTTSFAHVWEAVCKKALNDQLDTPLNKLELPQTLATNYKPRKKLIELIEKPRWFLEGVERFAKTLKPDLATFFIRDGETVFCIFDAKYYVYEKSATGMPGIGDIDKQYLYELAFKPFLTEHGITQVKNIFLMPTEGESVEYKGYVEFGILKKLGLENIQIVLVPAKEIYDVYLGKIRYEKSYFINMILSNIG